MQLHGKFHVGFSYTVFFCFFPYVFGGLRVYAGISSMVIA